MSKKRPGDDADKWELIRRLRYGALLKLFRHRWGQFPMMTQGAMTCGSW